jgi:hypothetical protein
MTEKAEKDIILFDDSNSYSFCYFYSGAFNQEDLELKLEELYTKKFGEDARFSYKTTQKTGDIVWFASVGCKGKDVVNNKINIPSSYFTASVIAKKYKDEYVFIVVEENTSLMVFLCYNEPIYSTKISNKILAISSGIGKEITKMSEIFTKLTWETTKIEKLIFYGSLPQEQIDLINSPSINKKIKETVIDPSLFDSPLNLALAKKSGRVESKEKTTELETKKERTGELKAGKQENPLNLMSALEIEIQPQEITRNSPFKEIKIDLGLKKMVAIVLFALILGASAFPGVNLFVRGMNSYKEKINVNIETLKNSKITELPESLKKEIIEKTTYLNSLDELANYEADILEDLIDKTLFRNSKVKINDFRVEEGVYILKLEVNTEKDLLDYLSGIIFSNKFVLTGAPIELLPEKSYELKIIPVPIS